MSFDIHALKIPPGPGIYLMKDAKDGIIYIGKAKNLKNRVRSYFTNNQNYKTQKLVQKIRDIEFVLTDTEAEAFTLESNMIKRYRPPYNIELKDQQRYTYLRITDERYPRLVVARRMRSGKFLGSGKIFGPFTHGSSKLLTIGSLRKAFKVRICKTLPKKVCLEYHLGNCQGPCEFESAQEQYRGNIDQLQEILSGRRKMQEFADQLRDEMHRSAQLMQFERAKDIRDTLQRLGSLKDSQKMERVYDAPDRDYVGIRTDDQTAYVMTLQQKNGVIRDRERFSFDLVADNTFSNFLYQYYTTHRIPRDIVASQEPQNRAFLERMLSKTAGYKVRITVPARGKKKEMMELVMRNIDMVQIQTNPALSELKDLLGVRTLPRTIECFDISNHGADYAVGSMSRFVDGQPDRSGYRKFRIKTISGQDDYAAISEVVKRRYIRLAEEKKSFPDLVLIDGGRGQLASAVAALEMVAANIPCVSLAKQDEEVFVPDKKIPVRISRQSESLKILQHARDEAHRFGVAYNTSLRKIKRKKG